MPIAEMAESPQQVDRDPGAPIARDAIDPELIKLPRARPKVGLITAAGMVLLCTLFLIRLSPDRQFGGEPDAPKLVAAADVAAGKIDEEAFVALEAEPLMARAIRASKSRGELGMRVAPVRGTGERIWLVLDGVGWDPPVLGPYRGRLRKLAEMPFGEAVRDYAAANPRPVFATAASVRAGLGARTLQTVDGDAVEIADRDRVAFDVIDPAVSTVIATFAPGTPDHAALLDPGAWAAELAKLEIPATPRARDERDQSLGQVRFDVTMPVAAVTAKLEAAQLWAARVEPVSRHLQTTWGELGRSGPAGFQVGSATIPDGQLDLVGIYVTRPVPDDAYALITNEQPQDYWYILPITIVVGAIGLLFAWALIRTIRRDLLPARA